MSPRAALLDERTSAPSRPDPIAAWKEPSQGFIGAFVVASVLGHVLIAGAMPSEGGPVFQSPEPVFMGMFEMPEPEPEPELEEVEEIEEIIEAPPPPPAPVRVRPEVSEPRPEAAEAETETTEEVGDPLATEAASHEAAGSVVSTEGGLTVDRPAGHGGEGGRLGPGRAAPAPPPVDRRAVIQAYLREVQRALGAPRYTRSLLRAQLEGTVMVSLRIDPEGRVLGVRVRTESGEPLLDDAALAHVQRVPVVPEPPEVLAWQTREIALPIRYRLE